jgi:ectoine hydroxylase-related dioxygenase (phytanoyl-CoA dioxygenase family)
MTEPETRSIKAELQQLFVADMTGRNNFEGFITRRLYALFAKTRMLDKFAISPLVLSIVARVLGTEHFQLSSPTGIEIGVGERAQVPHRDDGKYPLAQPHQEIVVNTMWAIDDFTETNGSTLIWPGTHNCTRNTATTETNDTNGNTSWAARQGSLGYRQEGDAPNYMDTVASVLESGVQPISAVMPKGSCVFYRGSVVHGGGANISSETRLGVILEYAAGWLRPQENHCLAVPPSIAKNLPPRLQELLGYNIHPPFIGYVDGRHPKRLLQAKL